MLGVTVGKDDVNVAAGEIASEVNKFLNRAVELNQFFAMQTAAGLGALGFTPEETFTLMQALADLNAIKVTFDASPHIQALYGMGLR